MTVIRAYEELRERGIVASQHGKGYFINTKTLPGEGLKIDGAVTPPFSKANPFVINLNPGWTQIGNPYTFPMKWTEVLDANTNPNKNNVKTFKTFTFTTSLTPEKETYISL